MDRKLVTNLAIFMNEYDDQQQQVTLPGPVSTVVNVASSKTQGIEFDMQYAPGNGWQADFALGLLDTEVEEDSFERIGGTMSIRPGRELTNSPDVTASFKLRKEVELDNGSLFLL